MKNGTAKALNILVVEDNPVNRLLVERLLSSPPLSVDKVESADSLELALELLTDNGFNVVLLDLNLPDSEGLDTLIKLDEKFPHIAKVVITGEYGEDIGLKAVTMGAQEYLVKGEYNACTLKKAISYALERKGAQEQLQNINDELNDFTHIVCHDLKAPLRGISSLAKWIAEDYADKLDDNGKEQLKLLISRTECMYELIEGVMQYSRVGRANEKLVDVDLNKLLSEAVDMIAPPDGITVKIESDLPTIKCERTRIMQVFQNLLSNAVKYMGKDAGQITIDCAEDADFWRLSVADTGIGIDEKNFEKIFQIFQTVSDRSNYESTGIGLTIVKKIVQMYGGKIWVESEPGLGSKFSFTLPKNQTSKTRAELACQTNGKG